MPRSKTARALGAGNARPPPEVVELAGRLVTGTRGRARFQADEPLKESVHRLSFEVGAEPASVVAKRLMPSVAQTNQLIAERWLPAAGLEWACARLLGIVHEPSGSAVWHIYEDIAGSELDGDPPDPERVAAVVELIAELHSRFAGHPLLAECRQHGADLGIGFFTVEVSRSLDALQSLGSLDPPLAREHATLRDRLLEYVERLHGERDERARLLAAYGGRNTLLHGDLWPTNTVLVQQADGFHARLVDWDHAGVGPVTYDLSTFLYRFSPEHRPWILDKYREAAASRGQLLPDDATLNLLFETAEYARYTCCLAPAARAAARGKDWAFGQLAEIDAWFVALQPVVAVEESW
jgi:phosphotransferase family enzyme